MGHVRSDDEDGYSDEVQNDDRILHVNAGVGFQDERAFNLLVLACPPRRGMAKLSRLHWTETSDRILAPDHA
jgi:hypothetical protein